MHGNVAGSCRRQGDGHCQHATQRGQRDEREAVYEVRERHDAVVPSALLLATDRACHAASHRTRMMSSGWTKKFTWPLLPLPGVSLSYANGICFVTAPSRRMITMASRSAYSVRPPAIASASSTVTRVVIPYRPGVLTWPITETLKLWTSRTMTETSGVWMKAVSALVSDACSCSGVNPAACTSLSTGIETSPSGRTAMARLISVGCHTASSNTSAGPITYS